MADFFALLPVHAILIDSRADQLAMCSAPVDRRHHALPEVDILNAPPGSAFVVVTHDHGLDFLLASAALERGDAAYVGLIGSKTKRAKFDSWCRKMCDGLSSNDLICPIGGNTGTDKRPSVIAALVAAEVMTSLAAQSRARSSRSHQAIATVATAAAATAAAATAAIAVAAATTEAEHSLSGRSPGKAGL
jgi:xanthine dehydrogenase accessory factor